MIASWLLDLTASALVKDPELANFAGRVSDSGEGRWTIKAAIDEAVPAPVLDARRSTNASARAAKLTSPTSCYPRCALGSAATWRSRPKVVATQEFAMSGTRSDALVFFGATGDLAYKKIFPALQAMVETWPTRVCRSSAWPSAGWNLDQIRSPRRPSKSTIGLDSG